ncbi:MAG: prephenate dehydrogenase [Candidatus Omnitrophota bacterium]
MKKLNKVAIVGVGLIGGSIGLALKKNKLAKEVIGIGRRPVSLSMAKRVKAVDKCSMDIGAAKDADLIILATPAGKIIPKAKEVFKIAKKGAVVTDAGSVKLEIVKKIGKAAPKGIAFVGAHPMAGSEKRGPSFARGDLFLNSTCILTKTPGTDPKALKMVKDFWKALGVSNIVVTTPARHDEIVAQISHMPHAAAVSVCLSASPEALKFASTGFRDVTRIAASDENLWMDIFMMNRKNIIAQLNGYEKNIARIKSLIAKKDARKLLGILKKARAIRENL